MAAVFIGPQREHEMFIFPSDQQRGAHLREGFPPRAAHPVFEESWVDLIGRRPLRSHLRRIAPLTVMQRCERVEASLRTGTGVRPTHAR